ncbi:ATP-binding cassette domain-containing protein [candidate division KSB3 bacterium]|uniref:ATP-binding cassette domain-containing protein n=1 Tax=candidate division KSB3 bacterium TaxID=2044937 RepID=A0A9D5JXX8_9BACT|nr:ATP-binding cassette domain-containing protein [candidate division KSB3 bacterium]MBD3326208.1 ATP-binding cassette domain-containing protein [candidate division KSB3 bacterium]
MPEPLIHFDHVTFAYTSQRPLLAEVNFELFSGERVGIMGPTGCGKTTFLHLLVGLLKPHTGTIRAFGRIRRQEKDFYDVRVRAGLMFQDPDDQLFCPTVLEDVAFGPLNLGMPPQQAEEISRKTLTALGLEGFEDRITYKLSYGEKHLIALATVLAMQPEVLLLDEPTNGLDAEFKQRLIHLLLQLPQAMIIVSHEREFIDHLATRTVWMTAEGQVMSPHSRESEKIGRNFLTHDESESKA